MTYENETHYLIELLILMALDDATTAADMKAVFNDTEDDE